LWENANGDGTTWIEHTVDASAPRAYCAYPGDIDSDGDQDIVGVMFDDNDVSWWENVNGDGTVWTDHLVDGNYVGARSVHVGDVDGDGDLDVLAAALNEPALSWWENVNGDGTVWAEHQVGSSFGGGSTVSAADLDSDGDLDVIGTSETLDSVAWWENLSGDGTSWQTNTIVTGFNYAGGGQAADLDGDGDLDILAYAHSGTDIVWWENELVLGPLVVALDATVSPVNANSQLLRGRSGPNTLVEAVVGSAAVSTDTDSDRLDDTWETSNFGDLDEGADADYDSDGYRNLLEFLGGTNPTLSGSVPIAYSQQLTGGARLFGIDVPLAQDVLNTFSVVASYGGASSSVPVVASIIEDSTAPLQPSGIASSFINSDSVNVSGVAEANTLVTVSGGLLPAYQQLTGGATNYSINVSLTQNAVNAIKVVAIDAAGNPSVPRMIPVIEGDNYPSTSQTLTAINVTPAGPVSMNLHAIQQFIATGTFSDASTADITEFVIWTPTGGVLVTDSGLAFKNTGGSGTIRANFFALNSNTVTINYLGGGMFRTDTAAAVFGTVRNRHTGRGIGGVEITGDPNGYAVTESTGGYVFLVAPGGPTTYELTYTCTDYYDSVVGDIELQIGVDVAMNVEMDPHDVSPPESQILEPADESVTNLREFMATGVVSDPLSGVREAHMMVSGTPYPIDIINESFFRQPVHLREGDNDLRIHAVDNLDNAGYSPVTDVALDTMKPTLVYCVVPDGAHVELTYSEPVIGADTPGNYSITPTLNVAGVTVLSPTTYRLTTATQQVGETYLLEVSNVTDVAGNSLHPGANSFEFDGYGTVLDSDGDGLPDYQETDTYHTDPNDADSDDDGLNDGEEVGRDTDPLLSDSDGDGLNDAEELALGTDPADADTDDDGVEDGDELDLGINPLDWDSDGDGLQDGDELEEGLDPGNYDSDGDGSGDGDDLWPDNPRGATDSDDDGLGDEWEEDQLDRIASGDGDPDVIAILQGRITSIDQILPWAGSTILLGGTFRGNLMAPGPPKYGDLDGDGCSNAVEFEWGTDPLDPASFVPALGWFAALILLAILVYLAALSSRRKRTSPV
jgi:hypothetical protein